MSGLTRLVDKVHRSSFIGSPALLLMCDELRPDSWVKESLTAYSPAWSGSGYGYMWWVAVNGNLFPGVSLPEGSFAALGTGGHFLLIIPAFDTVIVHRMESETNRQV